MSGMTGPALKKMGAGRESRAPVFKLNSKTGNVPEEYAVKHCGKEVGIKSGREFVELPLTDFEFSALEQ
jgi:hypothetical protein